MLFYKNQCPLIDFKLYSVCKGVNCKPFKRHYHIHFGNIRPERIK